MKVTKMIGTGLALFVMAGCNDRVKEKLTTIYEDGRKTDTYTVTKKFGTLKVKSGEFVGESDIKPWSSWWYPLNQRSLFYRSDGSASTLEKYDFYAGKMMGQSTEAARVEEQEIYQPSEVGWAGLCHAWAIASVLHPEPVNVVHKGGVKWSVGDQKALLLKTYELAGGIGEIMYGKRYNGNRTDDYDDIYPDQFHRLLQHHLIENRKPFLMDYDARSPVWTVPAYKVKFQIEKRSESSARVVAWVTFASPHVDDMDFVGTKRVVKSYEYILNGTWSNGSLTVTDGEWIGDSKLDHPDYLISFPDSIQRGSRNEEIKTSIVETIVK